MQLTDKQQYLISELERLEREEGKVKGDLLTNKNGYPSYSRYREHFRSFSYAKYYADLENPGQIFLKRDTLIEHLRQLKQEFGRVTCDIINETYGPSYKQYRREFETLTLAKQKAGVENDGPNTISTKARDKLNEDLVNDEWRKELIIGLLMGDGTVENTGKNANFSVSLTNKKFLKWLDEQLGPLTHGVTIKESSEDIEEDRIERGWLPRYAANCHDHYRVKTHSVSWLTQFRDWYRDGMVYFPDDLELTPTKAKMWYISDGGVQPKKGTVRITTTKSDRQDFLLGLFEDIGIEANYTSQEIRFNKKNSKKLLDYMGDAPPGFEHKWVLDDREEYEEQRTEDYGY